MKGEKQNMNKFLTKIAKIFLGLSMAAGVGVAVSAGRKDASPVHAAETTAYTLSGTSTGSGSSYNGSNAITQSNVSWTVNGNVSQNPWRIGGNKSNGLSSAGTIRKVQSTGAVSSQNITKVVVVTAKPSSNSINPTNVSLKVGTAAGGSQTSSLSNGSWAASVTFNRPSGADWSGKYFEIDFTMPQNNTSTNKFITFTSATFYYDSSTPSTYTVTYKSGDGTGSDYSVSGKSGSYTLLNYTDSNMNYTAPQYCTFGGWSVVIGSASPVTKNAGESITVNATTVCTALWTDSRSDLTLSATAGSSSVNVGSTLALTITATSGGNPVTGLSYTCSSSSDSIATVTNAGVISGVSGGSATITVSFAGNATYKSTSTTFLVAVVVPFPNSGEVTIDSIDAVNSGSGYAAYDGSHSTTVTGGTASFTWVSSNVMPSNGLQFKKSGGYIYNTVNLGNIKSVTPSSNSLTVYYGTSEHPTSGTSVGTGNGYFTVVNNTGGAISGASVTIEWGGTVTLDGISASLDSTASEKTWYVNDVLTAAEVDVTPSYSDESGSTIEDGTGIYFNQGLTETTFTFTSQGNQGNVTVPVYYQDTNGRTANTTFVVANVQPAKTVKAWSITGSIGETTKSTAYNLSGLTLHAWYDSGKTDEAVSSVAELYELVANPTNAGSTSNPNNTITVEVYLKTDTGHSNLLASFNNVAAPIVDAPKGSADNPYTIAEAMAAITWTDNTSSEDEYYATGYVKKVVNASTNHSYYLVDDPNDTESTDKQCLQAYNRDEPTDFDANATGDKVVVKGYLTYYNGQKELGKSGSGNGFSIISVDPETLSLSLSVTEENVLYNSSYSYSGTITANYKHKTDVVYDGSDERFTITSTVNTATVGTYSYSVTYDDNIFEAITESCTVTVSYAPVSSVTINGSSTVDMYISDIHEFTASLNSGVNPSTAITWNVANGQGSSFIEGTSNDYEMVDGILETHTSKTGTLIVTATAGGVTSSPVTVSITGNPVPTLDSSDLYGFVGEQGTIESSVVGGVAPYNYSWSITGTSGVASLNTDYGITGSDAVIDYLGHGDTVVTLTVTDSQSNVGTITANIHVCGLLNTVATEDAKEEVSKTTTFSTMSLTNAVQYTSLVCPDDSDITFEFGDGGNDGKYYDTGAAIRVYGSGHMTVSHASKTMTKIELTFGSGDGSNVISTNAGSYSDGTWTGSASSVTFNVATLSGSHRRIASVKVYWEVTTPGSTLSNLDAKAQKSVLDFAMLFNSGFEDGESPICTGVGTTNTTALASAWSNLADTFGNWFNEGDLGLTSQEIENAFALFAHADSVDQNVTSSADDLQHMLAKYDYIMAHYGESLHLTDFLHDSAHRAAVAQSPRVSPLVNIIGENTNTVAIIVIISMVSVTAIGGYFFLRKRKENI